VDKFRECPQQYPKRLCEEVYFQQNDPLSPSRKSSETGKGVNTPSFGRGIPALVIEPLDTASVEERAVGEKDGEWPYCRKGSSDTSAGRGLESLAPRPAFTLLGN